MLYYILERMVSGFCSDVFYDTESQGRRASHWIFRKLFPLILIKIEIENQFLLKSYHEKKKKTLFMSHPREIHDFWKHGPQSVLLSEAKRELFDLLELIHWFFSKLVFGSLKWADPQWVSDSCRAFKTFLKTHTKSNSSVFWNIFMLHLKLNRKGAHLFVDI